MHGCLAAWLAVDEAGTRPCNVVLCIRLPSCLKVCPVLQVELQVLRSFYKEQGKSPFPKLPWKTGSMHFRFLPVSTSCPAPSMA